MPASSIVIQEEEEERREAHYLLRMREERPHHIKMANGEKKDKTRNEKREEKQVEKPNAAKGTEEGSKPRPLTGALYTAIELSAASS